MKNYIIYNAAGKILRICVCANISKQIGVGEFVMEGIANDVTQKIEFDGLDDKGQPVNPRVVNKTPAELETLKTENPNFRFD